MTDKRPILNAYGQPASQTIVSEDCPQCGAEKDRRGPSSGFGHPHPICLDCGFEWMQEVWVWPSR